MTTEQHAVLDRMCDQEGCLTEGEVAAVRAALRENTEMRHAIENPWRPIREASLRMELLGGWVGKHVVLPMRYIHRLQVWGVPDRKFIFDPQPTHFIPIPAPPNEIPEGG